MIGLLDIAPVAETVSIRGKDVSVNGLSLTDIRDLLVAFPSAASLFANGVNAGTLMASAPDLVASAICLAIGLEGKAEELQAVKKLPAGDQVKLLNVVIRLSAPDGIGPFVELIANLASGAETLGDQSDKVRDTTSRLRSRAAPVMATKPPT
jgi:hypothetical protein